VIAISIRLGVKRKDLKLLAPVTKTAPAVIVAMAPTYLVKTLLGASHSVVILAVCGIVFGVAYAITAFVFGALTQDEKNEIYNRAQELGQTSISRLARKIASAFAR
jgi:hypothetical protein